MASLLPQSEGGYLPYFLLLETFLGATHTAATYFADPVTATVQFRGSRRPPPNGLLARVYGVKNVYTALIRAYAAYHIHNAQLYELAMFSFMGVFFLYTTEQFIYRTVRFPDGLIPIITSVGGLYWMLTQKSFYVS